MGAGTWKSIGAAAALTAGLLLGLAGCTGTEAGGPGAAVFYPPPPAEPRYQFLTSFDNVTQWAKASRGRSGFGDWLFGKEKTTEGDPDRIVNPYAVAARNGVLYICDLGAARIHVIDLVNNRYKVLGDTRIIQRPMSITLAPDGVKYVCDVGLRKVAVFDAQDNFTGYMGDPKRCGPSDVLVVGDELYVVDQPGSEIEVWTRDGKFKRSFRGGPKPANLLQRPVSAAVGEDGQLFVADTLKSAILVFDLEGNYLHTIGGPGDRPGYFARPKGLRIDPAGHLCIADSQWDSLQIFTQEGQLLLYMFDQSDSPHGMITPTWTATDDSPAAMAAFSKHFSPNFVPQFLMFVANEYGHNKISVFAFGEAKTVAPAAAAAPTTQPAEGAN